MYSADTLQRTRKNILVQSIVKRHGLFPSLPLSFFFFPSFLAHFSEPHLVNPVRTLEPGTLRIFAI
jgi:hypothetical protein